jgi:hypothetical protein
VTGAQAVVSPATCAQEVPPQQTGLAASQVSPEAWHIIPVAEGSSGAQMRLPGMPTQAAPVQQSSVAVQGAPTGAQTLRQESAPVPSGRQWPPQHPSESVQG